LPDFAGIGGSGGGRKPKGKRERWEKAERLELELAA
jgi:hypothetical protein